MRSAYLRTVNRVLTEMSVDGIISEFRLINNFGNIYIFFFFFFERMMEKLRRNFDPLEIEMINDALDCNVKLI